jgi:hypothetical protein
MTKVTLENTAVTAMDLTPQGGTPFARWFSCCLPKDLPKESEESKMVAQFQPDIKIARDPPAKRVAHGACI